MARKFEVITELYRRTQKQVSTPTEWQKFLRCACYNFRLSFDEQLLLYAQRPDATAVLPIEGKNGWNERFGRWVNRGATGIAMFDGDHNGASRLKFYYDISDTHPSRDSRSVPIWTVRQEHSDVITESLENSFGDLENKSTLSSALVSAALNAVDDNMNDYLDELKYYVDGSFMEELDELNIRVAYRDMLRNSVGYMLLVRCGINPEICFDDEDFEKVYYFNTPETLNALGVATGDISKMCISEIQKTVLTYDRQGEKENRTFASVPEREYHMGENKSERSLGYEERNVHDAGGLQTSRFAAPAGAGDSPWEIRITPKEVSEGEPQSDIHESLDLGQAERTPLGDRADGERETFSDHPADDGVGGRDGGDESSGSDEVGEYDEQYQSLGGGDSTEGAGIQLTDEPDPTDLPPFMEEKLIMAICSNRDDNLKFKKAQIELYFSVHKDEAERAEYLKSAYYDRYTEMIVDGVRIGYKPQEDGLLMWEGGYPSRTKESVFSWGLVAQWTGAIIDKHEFALNTKIKKPKQSKISDGQLSLFDDGDIEYLPTTENSGQITMFRPAELPQQIIDEVLCIGAGKKNSRSEICAYFMKDKGVESNAMFLAEHYGENGTGLYFDGRKISVWYNGNGIKIASGESANVEYATRVSWEDAAKRIRELLDLGRYMPQSEIDTAEGLERQNIAAYLWYTVQDFSEKAREGNHIPTIREIYMKRGGFPDNTREIAELLTDPGALERIAQELEDFVSAYGADRELMRFHYHRPGELLDKLRDLQRESVHFTAAEGFDPKRQFFITKDEIDSLIIRGSRSSDYRLSVYAYYRTHSNPKDREKYIREKYGIGGGTERGDGYSHHDGKGFKYSRGNILEPYVQINLKWYQIANRIKELIGQNKFLSEADRAAMPDYEREQLARLIHTHFWDLPDEVARPYSNNPVVHHSDNIREIKEQLTTPARVEAIYEMMLPVWENTKEDDRFYEHRKAAIEAMREYREGTYSVFGLSKTLEPITEMKAADETVSTPFWHNYTELREKFPDYFILMQMGDFYEAFEKDAEALRDRYGYTVTTRTVDSIGTHKIMSGFPSFMLDNVTDELKKGGFPVVVEKADGQVIIEAEYEPGQKVPVFDRETEVLYDVLGYMNIDDIELTYDDDGLVAKDADNEWHGVEFYRFLMDEAMVFTEDGTALGIGKETFAEFKELAESYAVYPHEVKEAETSELPAEEKLPIPPKPKREYITFETIHPEVAKDERHNFRITDRELGHGTPTEKYTANVEAIKLLKQIEAENRLATPEEQTVLSKYVGWGGLADCFDEKSSHYGELKDLLTDEEYTATCASSLTAFYTPPVVIEAMYNALSQMGLRSGNILEPSCGVGNFIGMVPSIMADSKIYGVELDSISGRIASQLYQNSSIAVTGFEKVDMPDSFFDAAIGNVPFGDFKVLDKRYDKHKWLIHDYFFGKTLDKVRPGGIVAFITSKGTMDKENSAVRKYLAQRADLIGAIRLPDNTFKKNAGTEVTSDIIFLQKRDRMTDIEPDWVHLDTDENGIRMNSYFVKHPDMILGNMVMESTRFVMDSACKADPEADLSEQLREAVSNLHAEITEYEQDEVDAEDISIPADPNVRNFSYTVVDGKLYFRENSRMHPVEASVTGENRIRGMITLRECVRRLIELQTEGYPDDDITREQEKLNTLYDDYTKKYGLLSNRGNSIAFGEDSSYCLLCSLEILDEEGNLKRKADMFTKRTIRPHEAVTSVDTASEALAVSISEKARVDMEYMSELSGKSEAELESELSGVVFRDIRCAEDPAAIPAEFAEVSNFPFVTADEYLSGNVRRKLRMAKAFHEVLPPEKKNAVAQNVTSLEAVQPVDLTAGEIGVRIGVNWIPTEIYEQFMYDLFGMGYYARHKIRILRSNVTGEWNITNKSADSANVSVFSTYGTKRINAFHILEQTLNQKDVRIFDTKIDANGNEVRILNKKETAIAQDRQELIKSKFAEWLWRDIDRRERLCRIYNETFNSVRPREYDGQHIRFSGMNPEISLRKHQVNAIAHIMYGGNTLLAHEVGAGKTFEMVAAAMESKRLGLCTKSLIVVPNHITEQWAAEWLQLYPSANILVATKKDFETKNRKKFCGRIATGDYDAIIIGHSQFEKIPMSKERQEKIIGRQIDEIMDGIREAKSEKAERYTIKQLERTKKSLETRLAKLNDQSRKDDVVTFEELGVDRIFVDESHYFKNLFLATKMRNVGGIAQTEAQKSSDLFMKCQYLDEITGGRGVVFATGTPISNSMVELYTIQRYLQYGTLQEMGLGHFDDWAANYGETITAIELSPEGSGYRAKTRFAKFYNLPELMSSFKQVADIQTADMLKLPVPKANFHTEVIKPSEMQQEMIKSLAERAESIRGGNIDPSVDNMLRITNDGRKLALDMRLVTPLAPDDENGKVATCARNVYGIWDKTRDTRGTQLVFCDLSTPKSDGTFSVYDDLKSKLIAAGIPEDEIAFIHDANSEAKKKELFSKVRSGQVRILMGSTAKMGAGTNVQDRLVALHDLDCPWRPSDLAQRLGRIVRQGNRNAEVDIYRYVTENTFDAYLYQLVENKQKFIAQIMTSKTPVRVADDVDETALSYSEIKALATGNPLIIEKCNLDMEVGKLNMLKANHLNQKYTLEDLVLRKYPSAIASLTERAEGYEKDIELAKSHPKPLEGFVGMTVLDTHYTEKEGAGKAIIDVCTRMQGSETVSVGEYRGFALSITYDGSTTQYIMTLKGVLSHSFSLGADVFGNITRMDNAIDGLQTRLEAVRDELENTKIQLERARTDMNEPFSKEAELAEKTARLKTLNILLNMDQKDKEILDDAPEEDVVEKEKVKPQAR